jgi:hypothetical protein
MSHYAESPSTVPRAGQVGTSGWVGWIAFASMMLLMLGSFHVVAGIVALAEDEYFLVAPSGLVLNIDYTTWGWVHLIGGLIVAGAGVGVLAGQMWARVVGTVVAAVSAILNIVFIAAYPLWSISMIVLSVIAIMALTVHGSEIKAGR